MKSKIFLCIALLIMTFCFGACTNTGTPAGNSGMSNGVDSNAVTSTDKARTNGGNSSYNGTNNNGNNLNGGMNSDRMDSDGDGIKNSVDGRFNGVNNGTM